MLHTIAAALAIVLGAEGAPVNVWTGADPSGSCRGTRVVVATSSGKTFTCYQGTWSQTGEMLGAVLDLSFSSTGCYNSGTAFGTAGQTVTFARATVAGRETLSSSASCSANQLRVEAPGVRLDQSRTSRVSPDQDAFEAASWAKYYAGTTIPVVTNNAAVAPDGTTTADRVDFPAISSSTAYSFVAHTTTTDAYPNTGAVWMRAVTGTATVYLQGSGSVACLATSAQWTRCVKPQTAWGSSTIAIGPDGRGSSGQPSTQPAASVYLWRATVERGSEESSSIASEGTRPVDALSVPSTYINGTTGSGSVWLTTDFAAALNPTIAETRVLVSAGAGLEIGYQKTGQVWYATIGGQTINSAKQWFPRGSQFRIDWTYGSGSACLGVNGVYYCATGVTAFTPSTIYFGSNGTANGLGGWVSRIVLGGAPVAVRNPYAIVAMGNSITAGYLAGTSYPTVLDSNLGWLRTVVNGGVSGDQTSQILARWNASYRDNGYGILLLLGGVNDIRQGVDAATIKANLASILNSSLDSGARALFMTILPFRGDSMWTADKEVVRQDVNAWIMSQCPRANLVCLDLATTFDDGASYLNPSLRVDYLHPNAPGQTLIATEIYDSGHAAGYW